MEIVFSGVPKLFYKDKRYARVRENYEEVVFNNKTYYKCDANSYAEAIERLIVLSKVSSTNQYDADYQAYVMSECAKSFDSADGDNFTLLLLPFDEWWEFLENNTIKYLDLNAKKQKEKK